jgi:hydroxyacylglutathione hydrolase
MFFRRIFNAGLGINTYLLGDEKSKHCVVVDPTRQVVSIIMQVQQAGLEITDILETHVHADFVSGSKELKHLLNGKPRIHVSGMGGVEWIPTYGDRVIHHGDVIHKGSFRLEAIHTPGHTPEHLVWLCYDEAFSDTIPWFALTGDCLFVGSVGRPDLLGEHTAHPLAEKLYQSLFKTLAVLPDYIEILPAHGAGSLCGKALNGRISSTLGYERLCNPYLKKEPIEEWIAKVLKDLPLVPPYFQRLKVLNVEGAPLLCTLKTQGWKKIVESSPSPQELFLLDVRGPDVFAHSHIQGSLNIPPSSSFCHWAGWMLPKERPIGLIIENEHRSAEVIDQLRIMGFDQPLWIIPWEKKSAEWARLETSFPMLSTESLWQQIKAKQAPYVIDVRTAEEWKKGHIAEAHHLELNQLKQNLDQIPKDQSLAVICASGARASLAASLLKQQGWLDIRNIQGGMQGWEKAGYPMTFSSFNV